jgi:hypothetical protein
VAREIFSSAPQPHLVLQALLRAAEIMGQLLNADADEKRWPPTWAQTTLRLPSSRWWHCDCRA